MKKLFFCILILLGTGMVFSQDFYQRILQEQRTGQISEIRALYLEALRLYAPEKLPEPYRSIVGLPVKSGFGLGYRIRSRWEDFSAEQRAVLGPFLLRPVLPDSMFSPSGFFKIRYAREGTDGVPPEDWDSSGIPDYVEEAAVCLDHVYSVEVGALGFNPPPGDRSRFGPEWNIYIRDLPGFYGMTNSDQLVSQNPDVYTSYMELDNDYTDTPTKGLDGLRVTAAHEFFHMIQLGYHGRDDDDDGDWDDLFLMEAGSTWMEDVVYDYVNDYYYYLPRFFSTMNRSFDYTDGYREYGLCLWFHFLEKRTGGREIVRKIWEEIVSYPAIQATDMALRKIGRTFEEELALFYGWNYMTGSRTDTSRFYPEGIYYPEVKMDATFHFQKDTTITEEVRPLAAKYFHFYQDDGLGFTIIPTNVNREEDASSEEFALTLIRGGDYALYTSLGYGIQMRLVSENYLHWKGVAVVEPPGEAADFIPFNGSLLSFDEEDLPASFPNPFVLKNHSMTTIPFILEGPGDVDVLIVHASGYRVKRVSEYYESGGLQFYNWDGKDDDGEQMPSGIYIYVVTLGSKLVRKDKIAVVR